MDLLSKLIPMVLAGLGATSAVDWRLSSFLATCASPSWRGIRFRQSKQVRRPEKPTKRECWHDRLQSFVLVVTSYHLCHILFVQSESLSPAHTRGDGVVTQEHQYQQLGAQKAVSEAASHKHLTL